MRGRTKHVQDGFGLGKYTGLPAHYDYQLTPLGAEGAAGHGDVKVQCTHFAEPRGVVTSDRSRRRPFALLQRRWRAPWRQRGQALCLKGSTVPSMNRVSSFDEQSRHWESHGAATQYCDIHHDFLAQELFSS